MRRFPSNPSPQFHQPQTVMEEGFGLVGIELGAIHGLHDVRDDSVLRFGEQVGFRKGLVGGAHRFPMACERLGFGVVTHESPLRFRLS